MEIIIGACLVAVGGLGWGLFFRARSLNTRMSTNSEAVKKWLSVHEDIQSASGALIEIRRVDKGGIFYREPSR